MLKNKYIIHITKRKKERKKPKENKPISHNTNNLHAYHHWDLTVSLTCVVLVVWTLRRQPLSQECCPCNKNETCDWKHTVRLLLVPTVTGGGARWRPYLMLHCHYHNDMTPALNGQQSERFQCFINCEGQSHSVHKPQLLKRTESWSGIEPRSFSLPAWHLAARPNWLMGNLWT